MSVPAQGVRDTSLDVYRREVLPTLGQRQAQVFYLFYVGRREDFTNMEIADMLNWGINRVTPRVFELRKAGILEASRKRECGVTGRVVWAWRLRPWVKKE